MYAAIASIAGPVLGASMTSGAAKDAAGMQAGATNNAIGEQSREFNLTRDDQQPYRAAGTSALAKIRQLLGLGDPNAGGQVMSNGHTFNSMDDLRQALVQDYQNQGGDPSTPQYQQSLQSVLDKATSVPAAPATADSGQPFGNSPLTQKFSVADFWNDPVVKTSYQAGLDLGTKALKNAAPLTTGLDSGAAAKELTKFGTDYTGNMAAGSQGRFVGDQNNVFNKMMALVGGGQVATQATGNAGMQSAASIGALGTAGANAGGAAKIAGANAWGNGMQSISNWWNQQSMLNRLTGGGGGGNSGGPMNWNASGDFPLSPGMNTG